MSAVKELSTKVYGDRKRWFGNLVRKIAKESDWRITNQEQLEELEKMLEDILICTNKILSELHKSKKEVA